MQPANATFDCLWRCEAASITGEILTAAGCQSMRTRWQSPEGASKTTVNWVGSTTSRGQGGNHLKVLPPAPKTTAKWVGCITSRGQGGNHLKVLPAASKTTAKWVGGGSSSMRVRRVRMKAKRMEVSSPVWVVSLTLLMPKWERYSRAKASTRISLHCQAVIENRQGQEKVARCFV